jgi:hypothetical protein
MIIRLDYDVIINSEELVYLKRTFSRLMFVFKTSESICLDYANDDTAKLIYDKVYNAIIESR